MSSVLPHFGCMSALIKVANVYEWRSLETQYHITIIKRYWMVTHWNRLRRGIIPPQQSPSDQAGIPGDFSPVPSPGSHSFSRIQANNPRKVRIPSQPATEQGNPRLVKEAAPSLLRLTARLVRRALSIFDTVITVIIKISIMP